MCNSAPWQRGAKRSSNAYTYGERYYRVWAAAPNFRTIQCNSASPAGHTVVVALAPVTVLISPVVSLTVRAAGSSWPGGPGFVTRPAPAYSQLGWVSNDAKLPGRGASGQTSPPPT